MAGKPPVRCLRLKFIVKITVKNAYKPASKPASNHLQRYHNSAERLPTHAPWTHRGDRNTFPGTRGRLPAIRRVRDVQVWVGCRHITAHPAQPPDVQPADLTRQVSPARIPYPSPSCLVGRESRQIDFPVMDREGQKQRQFCHQERLQRLQRRSQRPPGASHLQILVVFGHSRGLYLATAASTMRAWLVGILPPICR